MARLFFHKPRFAILDECTSAVTNEMSIRFYKRLQELNCSYITISHRPTLREFHDRVLALDGESGWSMLDIQQKKKLAESKTKNWTRLESAGNLYYYLWSIKSCSTMMCSIDSTFSFCGGLGYLGNINVVWYDFLS